jgi:chaperone modulatory protein CbpM
MIPRDGVLQQIAGLAPEELELWIASGWVMPDGVPDAWSFREIDVARIRLIVELRRDLDIDADTVPVILSLLDQLHTTRRDLAELCGAVASQPAPIRAAIAAAIKSRD